MRNSQVYSIYKATEGMSQKFALELLRDAGIKAEPTTSIYVGQTGVRVYGDKRTQRRAEKILFG